jgi:hypothetical protein
MTSRRQRKFVRFMRSNAPRVVAMERARRRLCVGGARPAAESGVSVCGHGINRAGIDLGERVYFLLGMTGCDVPECVLAAYGLRRSLSSV